MTTANTPAAIHYEWIQITPIFFIRLAKNIFLVCHGILITRVCVPWDEKSTKSLGYGLLNLVTFNEFTYFLQVSLPILPGWSLQFLSSEKSCRAATSPCDQMPLGQLGAALSPPPRAVHPSLLHWLSALWNLAEITHLHIDTLLSPWHCRLIYFLIFYCPYITGYLNWKPIIFSLLWT